MPQSEPSLDTRLPRQVRRQFQRATELAEQASRTEGTDDPVPGSDPAATPPSGDPSADPAPTPPAPNGGPAAEPPPNPEPITPPTPPADPRHNDVAYWKQRFNVEQGLTRQVRQERDQIEATLHQRIADLETEIAGLRAQAGNPVARPGAPAPAGALDLGALFTPEQRDRYGDDQLEVVASAALRVAREQAQAAIEEALQPIRQDQQQRQQREQRTAKESFNDALTAAVPDALQIDATDDWKAWLDERHEVYGTRRQDMLNAAVRAGNVAGTAALFRDYKRDRGLDNAAPVPPAPPPPRPPMAPRVAGGPPAAPVPPANRDQLPPTDAEVADFYKRRATKKKGDQGYISDEEARKFEARLQLRLRPPAAA